MSSLTLVSTLKSTEDIMEDVGEDGGHWWGRMLEDVKLVPILTWKVIFQFYQTFMNLFYHIWNDFSTQIKRRRFHECQMRNWHLIDYGYLNRTLTKPPILQP